MKKFVLGMIGILVLGCVGHARLRPSPGEFALQGEWLYFRPSVDDPFFAINGLLEDNSQFFQGLTFRTQTTDAKLQTSPFQFHSGYRIGGAYGFCGCGIDLRAHWTQLWSKGSDKSAGNAALPLGRLLGNGNVSSEFPPKSSLVETDRWFRFERFEALLGKCLFSDPCCFDFVFLAGLQYARVEKDKKVFFFSEFDDVNEFLNQNHQRFKERSGFWGVGPQVGFDFVFNLGCGASFTGNFEGALLYSKMDNSRKSERTNKLFEENFLFQETSINIFLRPEHFWRLVPCCDVRLGLAYACCFDCFSLGVEGGYQMISYFQAVPLQQVDVFTSQMDGYSNIGMQGPYASIDVTF